MTAYAFKGDAERCLTAGMDAYLSKPIQFAKLVETVEAIAEKAAACGHGFLAGPRRGRASAEPSDAAEQVFCLDEALASVAGEEDLFRQMVSFFFADVPKGSPKYGPPWNSGDAVKVARATHRLKER